MKSIKLLPSIAVLITMLASCETLPEQDFVLDSTPERALNNWVKCDAHIDFPQLASGPATAVTLVDHGPEDSANVTPNTSSNTSGDQAIIINGTEVDSDSRYPWAAQLYISFFDGTYENRYHCGGTILNENWIMTAAHCVAEFEAERDGDQADFMHVSVGVGGLNKKTMPRFKASNALCHADYNSPSRLDNDIALVRLDEPLDLSADNVGPALLPPPDEDVLSNQTGTVIVKPIGWGTTETRSLSDILLAVDLSIDPGRTNKYSFTSYQSTGQVVGFCQGDSGGGGIFGARRAEGSGTVLGIVSYTTDDCNSSMNRSGFTRVSTYRNDIESVLTYCDQTDCLE